MIWAFRIGQFELGSSNTSIYTSTFNEFNQDDRDQRSQVAFDLINVSLSWK